jgi:hypothetical protein
MRHERIGETVDADDFARQPKVEDLPLAVAQKHVFDQPPRLNDQRAVVLPPFLDQHSAGRHVVRRALKPLQVVQFGGGEFEELFKPAHERRPLRLAHDALPPLRTLKGSVSGLFAIAARLAGGAFRGRI